jgi:membrane-associated progesterone receptor component
MSVEELATFNGAGAVPEGRVDPPLYVGCNGKVFDVSFGGFDMYKPGAGYNRFAGIDASRALAKMSFEPSDVGSRDCSDLTPEQVKVLEDWADKFEHKKMYPVVGTLAPFETVLCS